MRAVNRMVRQAAAVLLAAPFLTFASALEPRHVHEPGPDDDHGHAVAHSHFNPHHPVVHQFNGTEIEQDEADGGHVVWLDSPILHEAPYQTAPVPQAIPAACDSLPIEMRWSVTPFDDAAPVHGPPKPVAPLRGPPTSLV